MARSQYVSPAVIQRLPLYYRYLGELLNEGCVRISSKDLAERMRLTASQIRQDLNCFGGFGQQGYGYNVEILRGEIGRILGLERDFSMIIVGAGNLGRAFATHMPFSEAGFHLVGIFDINPAIIGQKMLGITVSPSDDLEEFCAQHDIDAAAVCVPASAAASITDRLAACGIKAFWNFTNHDILAGHPNAFVENVHLSDSLMSLCYKLNDASIEE
ncbi:MAG: redox-sensing transcriptional repressor Rex [Oscillospiraceae bacterium]|nr:redox-sensing transcriptional repressor Rex [Oscillospiraceae bacterium]